MSTTAARPPRHAATTEPVDTQRVPPPEPTSLGALLSKVTEQMSRLVRDEFQLAQAQLTEKGKRLGVGAAAFAAAALFALYAFGVLLAAAVLGLSIIVSPWLAAIIVGVVLLVIAAICALVGNSKVKAAQRVEAKPQEGIKRDIDAVKKGIQK